MFFEWDPKKANANLRKHGVSFDEAASVFLDPLALTGADPDHSVEEARWITFGLSSNGKLLMVVHVDRSEAIRIISARLMTGEERRYYEEEI